SAEVVSRIDLNPLRAFDADHPGTRRVMERAPRLLDALAPEDAEHFAEVLAFLDAAGLAHEVDTTLVRGLDYYTRTVFEFTSDALGAQSGVGGGGRYDGLMEQIGGPHTPGMGFAAGVERMLMAGRRRAADRARAARPLRGLRGRVAPRRRVPPGRRRAARRPRGKTRTRRPLAQGSAQAG